MSKGLRVPLGNQRELRVRLYLWGVYAHVRVGLTWLHAVTRLSREFAPGSSHGRKNRRFLVFACWRSRNGTRHRPHAIKFSFETNARPYTKRSIIGGQPSAIRHDWKRRG